MFPVVCRYVIKTTDQDDDRKVFINMCHSKQVGGA